MIRLKTDEITLVILVDINPKINDKFDSYEVPDSFRKLIKKLLEAQYILDKNTSTPSAQVIGSFTKILTDYVDDTEIKKYIDDKTDGGKIL